MAVIHRTEPVIVHDSDYHRGENSGLNFLLGLIVLAIVAFLFLYYLLPNLRATTGMPQISFPSRIDVNLNQGK